MPFCPFCFRVPLLKLNIRKKGTLIVKGLLRNLDNPEQEWSLKGLGKGSGFLISVRLLGWASSLGLRLKL